MTRIISGVAGSLRLEVPPSGTRPTSDRVREAIFSTLDSWGFTSGTCVLDLYAGSGALGLEAASRGASEVTLVERHQQAALIAGRNVKTVLAAFSGRGSRGPDRPQRSDAGGSSAAASVHAAPVAPTHGAPKIQVVRQSVQAFLDATAESPHWDVVFIDPPYDLSESDLAANLAALVPLLTPDAAVMVERGSRTPEPSWPDGLSLVREKRYGETVLWWAEPTQASD